MPELDFLFAWHRVFADYVRRALDRTQPLRLERNDLGEAARCEIGRWLVAQQPHLGAMPAFQSLTHVHRIYHQLAEQLLASQHERQTRGPDEQQLAALGQASDAVTAAIAALMEELVVQGMRPASLPAVPFWDDSLRIGIDLIDDQHAAIAELAARVAQYPATALSSEAGTAFLTGFFRLVAFHFETEEQLMATHPVSASWREEHIRAHSAMLDTIVAYSYDQTLGRSPKRIADIMRDLSEIVVDHVRNCDFGFKGLVSSAP
jgi:hemerythrin-like metal-binding protein